MLLARRAAQAAYGAAARAAALDKARACLLLAGTLALGAVSFARLGNTAAPQTFVEAQSSLSVTATVDGEAESLMVYQGITQAGGQLRVQDAQGREVLLAQLAPGGCFSWVRHALSGPGPYTVTVTGAQVFELAFLDASGQTLPVYSSNGQALFDEQGRSARTAQLMRTRCISMRFTMRAPPMRQCTGCLFTRPHPPLGKGYYGAGRGPVRHDPIRMALHGHPVRRAACTGDLSSGARCAAAAAPAALAAVLWGFDFMRFAQTASAPSTPMLYFLFWPVRLACWASAASWHARASRAAPGRALRPLAQAFGCAAAVKWTGVLPAPGWPCCTF